ncbi:DUF4214 domain-containing protein [Mameliella sp.]|uniref:DUF4214 domain-containing protein n=1 Tax=Mameliella sp. TaxID=1924940 RepID=UPI003BA985E0
MTDYLASDLVPLALSEIVLHGVAIPDGIGMDTIHGGAGNIGGGGGTNEDFVRVMYQNTLDRGADAGGLAHWVGQLGAGASRADVLLGFSESPEMQMRSASDLEGRLDRCPGHE